MIVLIDFVCGCWIMVVCLLMFVSCLSGVRVLCWFSLLSFVDLGWW